MYLSFSILKKLIIFDHMIKISQNHTPNDDVTT